MSRGHHDGAFGLIMLRRPHGFLNAFRAAGAPENLLRVRVGRGHAFDQPLGREHFHFRHHIVGVARQRSRVFEVSFLKAGMAMPEIGHQHARREIEQATAVNGPQNTTLGLFHRKLRRRIGALSPAHHRVQALADRIGLGFPVVLDRLECACLGRHDLFTFPVYCRYCRKSSKPAKMAVFSVELLVSTRAFSILATALKAKPAVKSRPGPLVWGQGITGRRSGARILRSGGRPAPP